MGKYEQVVLIIEDYIFDIIVPSQLWNSAWFKKVSYQRWAGNEILNRVRRNPRIDPIDVLVDFAEKTKVYSKKSAPNRQLFLIANEMVNDILEIIKCMS